MAHMLTRLNVGDFDTWKQMFDQDRPRARETAKGWRVFRNAENPSEVYILVEFASSDDAKTGRERLLASTTRPGRPSSSRPRCSKADSQSSENCASGLRCFG